MRYKGVFRGAVAAMVVAASLGFGAAGAQAADVSIAAQVQCNMSAPEIGVDHTNGSVEYIRNVPATSTSVYYANCYLQQGSPSKVAVTALQNGLNQCYSAGIAADGIYGAGTRAAVIKMQRAHGITADGIWGDQSRKVMKFWATWRTGGAKGCSL